MSQLYLLGNLMKQESKNKLLNCMIFVGFFYIKLPVEIPHCSKIEQKHSILYKKIRLFVYFFFRVLTHIIKGEVWAIRNTYNSMLILSSTLCKIYKPKIYCLFKKLMAPMLLH